MNLLIRAAALLAAGAAGWALAKRRSNRSEDHPDTRFVYLSDEEAVLDAKEHSDEMEPVQAVVQSCYRRMNPFTLVGASEATFILPNGEKVKLHISGEGGLHLAEGDAGMLTWSGDQLILFEKENGEMIGGMYYIPAGEEAHDE